MSNKLVLLIEPEHSLREVLSACLSEFGGWRVSLAHSIREGIISCTAVCPDVILLDTATPEADALIFLEELKQYSRTYSIPILLISARASWLTPQQLRQMGFAGAITKPFNPSTVTTQISQLVHW